MYNVSHNLNVQYVCYSTGWKIKYFNVYRYRYRYFESQMAFAYRLDAISQDFFNFFDFFGPQMALAYRLDAISQSPKKSRFPWPNLLPLTIIMDLHASNTLHTGRINHRGMNNYFTQRNFSVYARFSKYKHHVILCVKGFNKKSSYCHCPLPPCHANSGDFLLCPVLHIYLCCALYIS